MKLRRMCFIYYRLFSQQLKGILEYQADFFIMIVAAALTQALGFIFLWVVFQRIPDIHGWNFWEVVFMYAMIFFTEGTGSLFFEGTWRMGRLVNMGELDRYLLRPIPLVLQIFTTGIGMNGIGNIVIGGVMIIQSLHHLDIEWTAGKAAAGAVLFISAIAIRACINLAANCSSFWIKNAGNAFPLMIHSLGDFAKYPITIFSLGIQAFVALIVPFAYISFFPASYLFDKGHAQWLGLLSPLAAVYCAALAYILLRIGLKNYESTGN